VPDGPLLRHLAVAAGIRERQPPRTPGGQDLGLRPSLPVRLASAAPHNRRPLLYLLITYGNPRNPPHRGGADRRAPRATDRLPRATHDRPMGHRVAVGREAVGNANYFEIGGRRGPSYKHLRSRPLRWAG